MEDILTATSLQWEIVRPGTLSNTSTIGTTTGITSFHKGMKVPGISRKNLAAYLVDEAGNDASRAGSSCPSPAPSAPRTGTSRTRRRGGSGVW
jgi:hypothetical protein